MVGVCLVQFLRSIAPGIQCSAFEALDLQFGSSTYSLIVSVVRKCLVDAAMISNFGWMTKKMAVGLAGSVERVEEHWDLPVCV